MAIVAEQIKLTEMRQHLISTLDKQQDKGGNCITLSEDECDELFAVMRNAEEMIDGLLNGYA